jgi:hypothetical protein
MSVPLHKNLVVRMLGYQRKREAEILREFGLNILPNTGVLISP